MAYNQYTTCVRPEDHWGINPFVSAALQALLPGGFLAAVALAAGMPWCLLVVAEVYLIAGGVAFCQWWLHDRLICLGGDRFAAGMLVSIEPADGKSGFSAFDTDYSINLLLYDNPPGPPDLEQADAEIRPPFGELIKHQPGIAGLGLSTPGEKATDVETGIKYAVLHAEFEGAGIRDLLIGLQVALILAIAAFFVCIAIPGPIGAIVAGILALLALLAALIGGLVGLGDQGSPTDTNPNIGALHTNDGANGELGADLLYVEGSWVYDSLHDGWNEIHPIKRCEKMGTWDGDWPEDFGGRIDRLRKAFEDADSNGTQDQQTRPQHQWQHHPDVDGCREESEPEPIH